MAISGLITEDPFTIGRSEGCLCCLYTILECSKYSPKLTRAYHYCGVPLLSQPVAGISSGARHRPYPRPTIHHYPNHKSAFIIGLASTCPTCLHRSIYLFFPIGVFNCSLNGHSNHCTQGVDCIVSSIVIVVPRNAQSIAHQC